MSEYAFVEQPFLNHLADLGWDVVDHGMGIPTDPAKSFRANFRELILDGVFRQSLNDINRTDDDKPWLTDKQIDDLRDALLNPPATGPLESNELVLKLLFRSQVDVNEMSN